MCWTHHQKVSLGPLAVLLLDEDAAVAEVLRQGHTQVRVVQDAEVIGLGRVRRAYLSRLHLEFGLAQTSSLHEDLVCDALEVSVRQLAGRGLVGMRLTCW